MIITWCAYQLIFIQTWIVDLFSKYKQTNKDDNIHKYFKAFVALPTELNIYRIDAHLQEECAHKK